MNLYLLVVLLHLPPQPSGLVPQPEVLHRLHVGASHVHVCLAEADKLAAHYRQQRAADVQRFRATVLGTCTLVSEVRP